MHIPDGFLSDKVCAATWIISAAGMGYYLKKTALTLKDKMIPLMGVMSAFIFVAQMLNFPVFGGTSGHLLGAALAAILLGPYAAAIVLTCVLVIQCLLFQDGGITALGANILNMALLATLSGYAVYRLILAVVKKPSATLYAAMFAAWVSVVIASFSCALELALSQTAPAKIVFTAMVGMHSLTGLIEAAITSLVVSFILKVRPDVLYKP